MVDFFFCVENTESETWSLNCLLPFAIPYTWAEVCIWQPQWIAGGFVPTLGTHGGFLQTGNPEDVSIQQHEIQPQTMSCASAGAGRRAWTTAVVAGQPSAFAHRCFSVLPLEGGRYLCTAFSRWQGQPSQGFTATVFSVKFPESPGKLLNHLANTRWFFRSWRYWPVAILVLIPTGDPLASLDSLFRAWMQALKLGRAEQGDNELPL